MMETDRGTTRYPQPVTWFGRPARGLVSLMLATSLALAVAIQSSLAPTAPVRAQAASARPGMFKLDHLIFIVQENRSFDHYFGTYPGADGLPIDPTDGKPRACVPDPVLGGESCTYHSSQQHANGGPHNWQASAIDVNGGAMDGFLEALPQSKRWCVDRASASCAGYVGPDLQPDVLSWKDDRDIPNYWTYADEFVLHDHMFAPADSWTLPAHLFLVSAWSASCSDPNDPMSCVSSVDLKEDPQRWEYGEPPIYAWTDITWLMDQHGVDWAYYVAPGTCYTPDCVVPDYALRGSGKTPAAKNPLGGFTDIHETDQLDHIQTHDDFMAALQEGTLPEVSWIAPGNNVSEHPQSSHGIRAGQAYVTSLVNAVMQSDLWDSTAIFITWDDWGGFYDHVQPPSVDQLGYGIRVPSLLISPYAKQGYIDHQTLSFDAYLKLIEDRFLNGERLDPVTLGRPDSRPIVREDVPILGDLLQDFDFSQDPRPPVVLDPWP